MLPKERAATSLRLEGPGLGVSLDPGSVEEYMRKVQAGAIVPDTPCDKGMQDNFALRQGTTVTLTPAAS
ncbi:hypothetical protein ACSNOI_25840 [Actinomadura kijaniata]|uniref:hypothetical protein n=1 Tax=Actinomadura kijaniata TaxID=46161 RepID=UPI003F1C4713